MRKVSVHCENFKHEQYPKWDSFCFKIPLMEGKCWKGIPLMEQTYWYIWYYFHEDVNNNVKYLTLCFSLITSFIHVSHCPIYMCSFSQIVNNLHAHVLSLSVRPKQCHGSTGYCWCVKTATGEEIEGTRIQFKEPQCTAGNCNKMNPSLPSDYDGADH